MPSNNSDPITNDRATNAIRGLTETDSLILKLSCEIALEQNFPQVGTDSVSERIGEFGIDYPEVLESLHVLDEKGYIEVAWKLKEDAFFQLVVTSYGFDEYGKVYLEDYLSKKISIAHYIINVPKARSDSIASSLGLHPMVVRYVLARFAEGEGIELFWPANSNVCVTNVSAMFKRQWKNL